MNSIVTERQECVCFLYGWSQRYVKSACVCVCMCVCACVCLYVSLPFAFLWYFCSYLLHLHQISARSPSEPYMCDTSVFTISSLPTHISSFPSSLLFSPSFSSYPVTWMTSWFMRNSVAKAVYVEMRFYVGRISILKLFLIPHILIP